MSSPPSPSSELAVRFPGLVELCSYVSNAWDYEYGTPQAAVDAFVTECGDQRESAAAGIDELFRAVGSEAERKDLLREFGFGYTGRPGTVDEFLIWTRMVLRHGPR